MPKQERGKRNRGVRSPTRASHSGTTGKASDYTFNTLDDSNGESELREVREFCLEALDVAWQEQRHGTLTMTIREAVTEIGMGRRTGMVMRAPSLSSEGGELGSIVGAVIMARGGTDASARLKSIMPTIEGAWEFDSRTSGIPVKQPRDEASEGKCTFADWIIPTRDSNHLRAGCVQTLVRKQVEAAHEMGDSFVATVGMNPKLWALCHNAGGLHCLPKNRKGSSSNGEFGPISPGFERQDHFAWPYALASQQDTITASSCGIFDCASYSGPESTRKRA